MAYGKMFYNISLVNLLIGMVLSWDTKARTQYNYRVKSMGKRSFTTEQENWSGDIPVAYIFRTSPNSIRSFSTRDACYRLVIKHERTRTNQGRCR